LAGNFYTILTITGKSKLSNSVVSGNKLNFKTLKVGDGKGTYYEPSENQTALVNTVWTGNITSISIDENNSNWIVVETVIPASDGGFFIREAGIFDDAGDMIAISKLAETYKPVVSEGSTKDLVIKIVLEVSNTCSVTLKIDPTVMIATKADVQVLESRVNSLANDFNAHIIDYRYELAGGTATALTVSMQTLVNGYAKTFVASANNGGSLTTVNSKKLYKPGTTISPNLIAGKAYTIWYSPAGDCFFIKASAEGTTIASHVLAGDTFSNDTDTGLVGTMPDNGTLGGSLAINGTYTIPAGYTTGGTITQSIITKGATTYNPSTTTQTIAAGQYVSGAQTINPVTGTANAPQVLSGYTFASANGIGLTGAMANNGAVVITPSASNQTIATGYHNGSGYVKGDANLVSAHIVNGINLFGLAGSAPRYAEGSIAHTNGVANTIDVGFTPRVVQIRFSSGSAIYTWITGFYNSQSILTNGSGTPSYYPQSNSCVINGSQITFYSGFTTGTIYYYIWE